MNADMNENILHFGTIMQELSLVTVSIVLESRTQDSVRCCVKT